MQSSKADAKTQGDIVLDCQTDAPPKLPDGDYEVSFIRAEKQTLWKKQERVFLWFSVLTPGPYFGDKLFMVCTIAEKGKWGVGHKFYRAWSLANGKAPNRRDRLSTNVFREKVFIGRVRTVTHTSKKGITRPPEMQYSILDELVEVSNRA